MPFLVADAACALKDSLSQGFTKLRLKAPFVLSFPFPFVGLGGAPETTTLGFVHETAPGISICIET